VKIAVTNVFAVSNVPEAEAHYHAHEFLDATVQPKSIFISPNEVYNMHALLSQALEELVRLWLTFDAIKSEICYRRLDAMIYYVSSCKSWMVSLM
jgi:hypothetical protein